jgi:hypothetical protein
MILNTIKNRIAHPDSLREFSGHSFRVGAALDPTEKWSPNREDDVARRVAIK